MPEASGDSSSGTFANEMIRQASNYLFFIVIGIFVGLAIGYFLVVPRTIFRAADGAMIAEFKVHHHNLEIETLDPQLREYLKSRMYFLANFLEPRDLGGFKLDFGPVDVGLLKGASGIKGPIDEAASYHDAMTKHKRN